MKVSESGKMKLWGAKAVSILFGIFNFLYRRFFGSIGQKVAWPILLSILYLQYLNAPLFEGVRNRTFDIYQKLSPRPANPDSPVVIVDIDEKSIKEIGQWPWSRDVVAEIVKRVTKSGAVVIGFDIVFSEKDRMSPPLLSQSIKGLDEITRQKLRNLPGNDEILARAMKNSRVVLGGYVTNDDNVLDTDTLKLMPSINWIGKNPDRFIKRAKYFVGNVEVLEQAAAGYSNFSLDNDFDGVIRRIPLVNRVDKRLVPILGLDVLRVATGRNVLLKSDENGILGVVVARTQVPTDGFGRMWIRYSKYTQDNYISAVDILTGSVNPRRFTNKIVLVGTSATGLKDLRSTPIDNVVPGVEVHSQMLQTILTGDHLYRGDLMRAVEWVTIFVCGVLLILFMPLAGSLVTFLMLLVMIAGATGTASYLFTEKSILMDISFFITAVILLYIVLVYSNFRSTEQQRGQIRSAFSHYLSPALVNQLSKSPEKLQLGGEERNMSFLFCDIRGFTAISEQFADNPQGLTQLINDFLTPMTEIILEHGGTIDKYMGDCIMAFWNAPLDDDNHAKNAVVAALEMHRKLEDVNLDQERKSNEEGRRFVPINVGIGINTGHCVVGNMGSEQRFDYSVLGDAVNLASRLEGQCKTYGMKIIVGEETAQERGFSDLIELDLIAVKGKSTAIKIYGCIQDVENLSLSEREKIIQLNSEMISAYRNRDWALSQSLINNCINLAPLLNVFYQLYLDRIAEYITNDPGEHWDGVFYSTSK
jgi:adenylate cyclase